MRSRMTGGSAAATAGAGVLICLMALPAQGGWRTAAGRTEAGFSLSPARPAPAAAPARPAAFSLTGPAAGGAKDRPVEPPASAGMPKNWDRFFVEIGILSVYSTISYWLDYHEWVEDWQYELTCEDQYRRFFTLEAIRFDSNAFSVNWTHVIGGSLYYQLARTNYLTWGESLLAAFGASLVYEYVSEWREVISVNDMFLTTAGGYAVGETWFQLSSYFHHQKSPLLRALAWMNPMLEINKLIDRNKPASKIYVDPGWHSFVLSAGWRESRTSGGEDIGTGYIAFESQIIHVPEYGRSGSVRKSLRDTSMTELSFELALRSMPAGVPDIQGGWDEDALFEVRAVSLAWYRQNIDDTGRGHALSIGLGSALTYLRKRPVVYDSRDVQVRLDPLPETPTDFREKMAVAHLAGPVVDWTGFFRGLKVRAVADAYVDFAMMGAYAFNAYSALHSIEGMKTTLNYYAYHYAFGFSVSGRVDLDWRGFWLRGLASYHAWDSIEGLDRFQDDLTDDGNVEDSRTRYLLKAGWRVPKQRVRLFFALEEVRRWGRIADVEASGRETRTYAGLSYLF